jgi:hypothetical protein
VPPEPKEMPGNCPLGSIGAVEMLLPWSTPNESGLMRNAIRPVAMKFSMIVEMTSLTPR